MEAEKESAAINDKSSFSYSNVFLVAQREVKQRLSTKAFRVATIITVIAAFAYVFVPHALASKSKPLPIGVEGASKLSSEIMTSVATELGQSISFVQYTDQSKLANDVRSGKLKLGYEAPDTYFVNTSSATDLIHQFAITTSTRLSQISATEALKPTSQQLDAILNPVPGKIIDVAKASPTNKLPAKDSLFELVLMYVLLGQYGAWVMLGVIEEKSTRVVEVLLSTLRPIELLTGKIAGIAVVAILHAAGVIAALCIGLFAIGSSPTATVGAALIVSAPIYFILGFAFYSTLFGAVGSMVSRTEDAQAASFPIVIPMLVGYIVSIVSLSSSTPHLWIKLVALVPGVSPFLAPPLLASGQISFPYFLATIAISLVATVLASKVAARVYEISILQIGARVNLKTIRRAARTTS
ncbi:MAG: ABC transporter permease [Actinomycetota bacterium]|nr:ABC transporter permease [Actinomycetota bacterium]